MPSTGEHVIHYLHLTVLCTYRTTQEIQTVFQLRVYKYTYHLEVCVYPTKRSAENAGLALQSRQILLWKAYC